MMTLRDINDATTAVEKLRLAGIIFEEMLVVETIPARREKLQELSNKYKYLWLKLIAR